MKNTKKKNNHNLPPYHSNLNLIFYCFQWTIWQQDGPITCQLFTVLHVQYTFQEMSTFFCHPIIPAHSCMDIERSSFDPNESDLVGA